MTVFPLLAVGFLMKAVAALFIVCCVSLILIILIQKGRGGGLSGAFGGAMASGILGSKTGDFLTWVTIVLVGVFLTLAVVMAKFYRPDVSEFGEDAPARQVMPASPEQPSAPAGMGQTTSEDNAASDVNSPGG
ncbi:MAG: preprotein translocase subunit SecG [Planctomycetes bacterium]|nr:preprotein translocase subunit SecG [Planctomycetota bacterium]MBL7143014.1 preprotein translocase subunit SecG [Phycisphaerae bacterium]